jgi:hypothetical protein
MFEVACIGRNWKGNSSGKIKDVISAFASSD